MQPLDLQGLLIKSVLGFTAANYYGVATTTILFYDYLSTLADEVEYIWSGKKSSLFVLFILNRYPPIAYQIWLLIAYYRAWFSQKTCEKTAFISILVYVWCTLLAQIALTWRVYAITRKNCRITACVGVVVASQLGLGISFVFLTATAGALEVPEFLSNGHVPCTFVRQMHVELAFPAISLLFDLLVFVIIIYTALHSTMGKFRMHSLFRVIMEDATRYFLIVFASHLTLELTLIFGDPVFQLIPASGNVVYLPVMIARLILSLKKASVSQEYVWSLGDPGTATSVRFAGNQGLEATRDEIGLDNLGGRHKRARKGE